ncbi:MAG: ABC transporter permease [Bauldia sp.]|nr:ABC transporter permease [Bauldia sp.]
MTDTEISAEEADAGPGPSQPRLARRLLMRPEAGGVISAIVVFAFFAILAGSNGFLSPLGVAGWLDTAAELGIIAIPIGMLMIAGEFDLSVGSVVGATSIIIAMVSGYYEMSPWLGIAIAFAFGAAVGLINGIIVVWTKLPSFIVTLATMMMVLGGMLGVSIALTGSTSISAAATGSAAVLFAAEWRELHVSIIYWIVLIVIATYVMQRTPFGNWAYATGGSAQTARLAGVPVARVKIILFVCTSLGAVLTSTLQTMTFQNGNVTLGAQYVFTGIAASVIGGVLLTGGYGSPLGTVSGALTYGIVSLGVFYLGWNADLTEFFIGALLLLAVLANHRLRLMAMGRE